jgi:hypothetical protein
MAQQVFAEFATKSTKMLDATTLVPHFGASR